RLLDDPVDAVGSQRGGTTVDVAADVRLQVQQVLGGDGLAARNAGPARVAGHDDAVRLGGADLRQAVARVGVAAEPELRQGDAGCLQVGEVLLLEGGLQHHGPGMHGHASGTEVLEAGPGRDRQRLDPGRVVGAARRVDLPGRDDAGDSTMDVTGEEVHRLL